MQRVLQLLFLFVFITSCNHKELQYTSPESLENATIAVAISSPHDSYVTKTYPNAKIIRLESMAELPIIVANRDADFAVIDRSVAKSLLSVNKDVEVVDPNFMSYGIGAAFSLDKSDMRDEYNRFLAKFTTTETFADIMERWDGTRTDSPIPHIEQLKGKPVIRVGVSSSVPPFCIVKDNQLAGISVEIIKHFALEAGYTVEFIDMNISAMLSSLQSGRVDVVDSGLIYTEERAKNANFSNIYYTGQSQVIARKTTEASAADKSSDDYSRKILEKSRVVVMIGSTSDNFATNELSDAKIVRVENFGDTYPMLDNNYADYTIADYPDLVNMQKQVDDLEIVEKGIAKTDVAAAFSKSNVELQNQFNDFLTEFRNSADYEDMTQRWYVQGNVDNLTQIDACTTGEKIVVAVDPSFFPNVSIIDNKLEGFEIELVRRFALDAGYQVEFMQCNFPSIISSLASGKADMGVSVICVTEERQKNLLFSEPYNSVALGVARINKKSHKYIKHTPPKIVSSIEGQAPTVDDTVRCCVGSSKVAAVEGTVQEHYLSTILPSSQIAITKDYSDALLTLVSNKAQFLITNIGTAKSFCKAQESTEVVLSDIFPYTTHFGINKKNTGLRDDINLFLDKCDADGTLDKLYDKWLTELDDAQMQHFEFNPSAPVLQVGCSGTAVPFNFIVNGEPVGLDVEILAMYCHEAGYRMEVLNMPFGALISSLVTGKVDVIANTLTSTEERRQKIDFTRSYGHNCFAVMGNRQLVAGSEEQSSDDNIFTSIAESFQSNVIAEKRYVLIMDGVLVTLIISILSIILGTIMGACICSLTMSNRRSLRMLGRGYVTIVRGTPVLVILMINFYVIFAQVAISPVLVATISFAMNFGAYVSEMFRSSIISIDKGQREAGLAMGFSKIQTFILIIAPQTIKRVLPVYKGEAISLVKMTSIVGYIAVQDITKVGDIIRSRTFDAFFPLLVSALLYFLIAYVFSKGIDLLTNKIIRKDK